MFADDPMAENFPLPNQFKPGTADARMIDGMDLAPTMLAFVGQSKPSRIKGRVFVGSRAESAPMFVFGTRDGTTRCPCVFALCATRTTATSAFSVPQSPFLTPNNRKLSKNPVGNLLKGFKMRLPPVPELLHRAKPVIDGDSSALTQSLPQPRILP
jgi:hypothetical protein